jgi:hypothetical protein
MPLLSKANPSRGAAAAIGLGMMMVVMMPAVVPIVMADLPKRVKLAGRPLLCDVPHAEIGLRSGEGPGAHGRQDRRDRENQ